MEIHPTKKAFNAFREDNPKVFDVTTLQPTPDHNQFLENRLMEAFYAGIAYGEQRQKEVAVKRFSEVLFG